jgi:hypothetical protein
VKGSSTGGLVAKVEAGRGVASSLTSLSSSCSATGLDFSEGACEALVLEAVVYETVTVSLIRV